VSDAPQGPGWWQASDLRWYPPEQAGAPRPTPAGPRPPGGGRRRTVLLSISGVAVVALVGVVVALIVGRNNHTHSSTIAVTPTVPGAVVPTSVAPTSVAPTSVAPTSAAPPTTARVTTTAPGPPCSAADLFTAAVAKEGFNPDDPSYAQFGPGQAAGAYQPTCVGTWAIASISRPQVGTTDGATLFHAVEGTWAETAPLGAPFSTCTLTGHGVPQATAEQLMTALGAKTTC